MPWCQECSKYLTPTAMQADGTCPTCGRPVSETESPVEARSDVVAADETTPWHFKLLVVALVLYLGWRFVDIFV